MSDDDEEFYVPDLIGRRLEKVTASWFHHAEDAPELQHLWLHMEGLGPVLFHTPSTGLQLSVETPHEPYSMDELDCWVTLDENSPVAPGTRFVGEHIRSVREIGFRWRDLAFPAGLTLQFPTGHLRLAAIVDELLVSDGGELSALGSGLHEDVTLARVVQTCTACPSQWDAWTTNGQYLYLRYRHGEGTVEQHPGPDDSWDTDASRPLTAWQDGTNDSEVSLPDFLSLAGLRLAPDAEVIAR